MTAYFQYQSFKSHNDLTEYARKQEQKILNENKFYSQVDSLVNLEQFDNAINLLEKQILNSPVDKEYFLLEIGNIYYEKGDLDSALLKYSEAINTSKIYIKAYVNRGWVLFEKNQLDSAIKDFKFAAERNFDFYYDLAIAQEKKGLFKESLNSFNIFIQHYPDNEECISGIERLKRKLKENENGL